MRSVKLLKGSSVLTEVADPHAPKTNELLVRVEYSALNNIDLIKAQESEVYVPGIEFSGTVIAVGEGTSEFNVGDNVMGLCPGGAQSEFLLADSSTVVLRPDWINPETAAGMMQSLSVGFDAISQLQPEPGDTVLVRGINSMLGRSIAQFLVATGLKVYGIARNARGSQIPGLEIYLEEPEELKQKVTHLFECVGPSKLDDDLNLMAVQGKILLLGGSTVENIDFDFFKLMFKRLTLIGSTFGSRPTSEKSSVIQEAVRVGFELARIGKFRIPAAKVFNASEVHLAYEYFRTSPHGKVILAF